MVKRKTNDIPHDHAFDWILLLKPDSIDPDKRYSWMTREQFELAARTFYALQATAQKRARTMRPTELGLLTVEERARTMEEAR